MLVPGLQEPPIAKHDPSPFKVKSRAKELCDCGIAKSDRDMWLRLLLEPRKLAKLLHYPH